MRHFLGSKLWDFYSYFYDPLTRRILKKDRQNYIHFLMDAISQDQHTNMLIIGVGTGEDLVLLDQENMKLEITAIDYSQKMLLRAKSKNNYENNINFIKMDAHRLLFPDNSFSIVLMPLVLTVAKNPLLCLKEACRVLKPGGFMIVYDKFVHKKRRLVMSFQYLFDIFTNLFATSIKVDFHKILEKTDLKIIREESSYIIFKTFLLEKPQMAKPQRK